MGIDEVAEKTKQLWNKETYYQLIEDAQNSGDEDANFFSNKIAEVIKKINPLTVLDVGCGEGGIVKYLSQATSNQIAYSGVDVAEIGIERANKKQIPNASFRLYDGDVIPFPDKTFDLCFSTFVFEHLTKPEAVFSEMSRVTKPGGYILIACPNYGSPFFRSPCNKTNKALLMVKRLAASFLPRYFFKTSFRWQAVNPIILPPNQHIMDYDTTIEPNLLFFARHIKANGNFKIIEADSYWTRYINNGTILLKRMFLAAVTWLGRKKTPIIKWYGPFFFILLQKKN